MRVIALLMVLVGLTACRQDRVVTRLETGPSISTYYTVQMAAPTCGRYADPALATVPEIEAAASCWEADAREARIRLNSVQGAIRTHRREVRKLKRKVRKR